MTKAKSEVYKYRKGKWIDASEEIDKAIAKAYEQGKSDGDKIATKRTLSEVLKFVKSPHKEDYNFDLIEWLEQKLKAME